MRQQFSPSGQMGQSRAYPIFLPHSSHIRISHLAVPLLKDLLVELGTAYTRVPVWEVLVASPASAEIIAFGEFEAKLGSRELCRKGTTVRLPNQSFQILAMLLERRGELVTREEIRQRLWPRDTFVDFDHGLNNAVNRLREALGDSADTPRFVETLPRRGYRFIASVLQSPSPMTPASASAPTPVVASEQRRRIRRWIPAASASLLLLAILTLGAMHFRRQTVAARISSLAVLPLENVSGDPTQDYFADGMTDALITDLAGLKDVRVISRTSAMHYKGTHQTLPEIARELGVDAVVEGTFSKAANHVRINAQLIDARDDRHIWSAAYDRDIHDLLALQAELADAISGQVAIRLNNRESLATKVRGINPEAYEAYLRGRYEHSQTPFIREGEEKARIYFNRAIQVNPDYSDAIVALAETYIPADLVTARLLASRALELNENSAEGHAIMGTVLSGNDWNFPAAEQEFRRAIELNPNSVVARGWYGLFLAEMGRFDEALGALKYAQRLDPFSAQARCNVALALYLSRRYDDAVKQLQDVISQYPDYQLAHRHLMRIYEQREQIPEYLAEFAKAPGWFDLTSEQAERMAEQWKKAYLTGGAPAFWHKRLAFEQTRSARGVGHSWNLMRIYAQLGDSDHALTLLREAYDHRDPLLITWIKNDPQLDHIRSDVRFEALMKQIGFQR